MFLSKFQKYLFFQCFQEKLIRIAAVIAPQYVSIFTRVPPCNIEKNKIFQKHFILMKQVALIKCIMFLSKFQKYLFFQYFQEKLIRIAAAIAPQYVSIFTRVPPCNIEKNKNFQKHFILMEQVALMKCIMFLSKFQKYLFLQCFLMEIDTYCSNDTTTKRIKFCPPCNIEKNKNFQKHFILMKQVALIKCIMFLSKFQKYLFFQCFLGEVDTYRGSDSAAIRINFYKGPPL